MKFRKRDVGCWRNDQGIIDITPIEFSSENELFDFIKKELPFTDNDKYPLHISDGYVVGWTVVGFIVDDND